MAINTSASNLTLGSVALKVLDERASRALAASGGHCSGDLHILVVYLQSENIMWVVFLAFLLQTFPNDVTKQIACPTACQEGFWASLP
ncbi:hypothetical protein K443DRAFT_564794 [Laccaria amethystina LaAM-08-1]|uniref:Uncharacterized protein n=1 Tax=Laccaria amethystina LaAM-08-1 TaxID=1095629 RepID=A0A0C9X8X5_9AGAR|nr:hypothetical protein K443DRAFT_564794 [Laccaria amethystina LaAM-08-1]